jgi:periplasmic divalent cation tolerance protein
MSTLIAFCTCPDTETAERIAAAVVQERLAACVNRLPGVVSTYRWQGEIHRDNEHLLLIKTTSERFAALRDRIVSLHPYDVPEVVAVAVVAGFDPYLAWIESQTSRND